MQVTAYYTKTPVFTLTRKNTDFSSFDFKLIEGDFLNKETEVAFSVKYLSGLNYEVTNGENKMIGILLSKDEVVINDYNYRLKIQNDDNGIVSNLLLTSDRIQNVTFSRII